MSRRSSSSRGRAAPPAPRVSRLALVAGLLTIIMVAALVVLVTARSSQDALGGTSNDRQAAAAVSIPHLHGMGFTPDGQQLFVAAHDGFRVYADGTWSKPELPVNDYMGYSPVDSGFYSSGHPGPGTEGVNPLGLIKSSDGGRTLTTLGFAGESDFHLLGAGYKNHAVYLFNPQPNSQLAPGLHYTTDDGRTWTQARMEGITAQPVALAVHPLEATLVALATESGLFLSLDAGQSFQRVGDMPLVTAAAFDPQGERLFFGATSLAVYNLQQKTITHLQTPALRPQDAVAAIASNPAQPAEIVFGTFERDIYRSTDGGQRWQPIARNGQGVQ